MQSNAYAILVGLKRVDPRAYENWTGENGCSDCEADVDNVARVLRPLRYKIDILKTATATRNSVVDALGNAGNVLCSGDTLVFYYAGHGGRQPDEFGDDSETRDETLCAYDGEIIDDQLSEIWRRFRSGVRIVMISDSCNTGTNYRNVRNIAFRDATPIRPVDETVKMKAEMIHLATCRNGETPSDGHGGAFTTALRNVWNEGAFSGNYQQFVEAIRNKVPGQIAQITEYDPVSDSFRNERPFSGTAACGRPHSDHHDRKLGYSERGQITYAALLPPDS